MEISENKKITIIGSGHIAQAILRGLIYFGHVQATNITVSNPSGSGLLALKRTMGVRVAKSNKEAAKWADWILLAVKPRIIPLVVNEICEEIKEKLLISTAVGVDLKVLMKQCCNNKQKIIRIMPNIPVSVDMGVIGFCANRYVNHIELKSVKNCLRSIGRVYEVKEKTLNTLTIVSGCGPAIVANFIVLMATYASKRGLSQKVANSVILQTFKGTIAYMENEKMSSHQLIQRVATKGGITEAILQTTSKNKLQANLFYALNAGYGKINRR